MNNTFLHLNIFSLTQHSDQSSHHWLVPKLNLNLITLAYQMLPEYLKLPKVHHGLNSRENIFQDQ